MTLTELVRVAGRRWTVEESFQTGKGLTGLDQHQVRTWTSWHRWTVLVMLAHAFLAAATATQRTVEQCNPLLIRLSVNEFRQLFVALVLTPLHLGCSRVLDWSIWRRGGRLTRSVTVPVSAGLLHNTAEYFEALGEYRSGNVEPIVRSIVDASFAAIANGRHLVRDLESVRADWRTRVTARRDSAVHRLVDLLLRQPVVDSKLVASTLAVTGANAQIAIDRLLTSSPA